ALLKSIEEPPPHVAFMMATTALDKIPDTIISRSHVFEFRIIPAKAIAAQLRRIADAERIDVADEALALIARAADGSMRDAETAFDQVMAFAGETVTIEDVSTVLGLVGRDLLLEIVTAVADENAPAAFDLAGRAVEAGNDLRLVCRELARMARDLLVVSVDPSRLDDPEVAPEGDRDRLAALAARFSREDLLRAFDVLARAEGDIRNAPEPRYHFEMALLRWMHLRRLVPLTALIESLQQGKPLPAPGAPATAASRPALARTPLPGTPRLPAGPVRKLQPAIAPGAADPPPAATPEGGTTAGALTAVRDAFLSEIKRTKAVFFGTVVAQAQRIDFDADRVVFAFSAAHRILGEQVQQNRAWLESLIERLAGRKVPVIAQTAEAVRDESSPGAPGRSQGAGAPTLAELKTAALADPAVKALFDVFPSEIREVEEITDDKS
ncbi:MAG: hypothetical protein IMZ67_01785, partial [Acidobacteria bacterium]|nr:hypothetical protein [Acidobacteriota bacterium]